MLYVIITLLLTNRKQLTTMTQLDRAADEAVYILQLSSQQAKKYIQRNANCAEKEAGRALLQTVTFHKHER